MYPVKLYPRRTASLVALAIALLCAAAPRAGARTLEWAGKNWVVKNGSDLGPGPNDWSDSTNTVWVDENGFLHLKIAYISNAWHCAEVVSEQSFGYGEYRFKVATDLDQLDTNTVGGLFTYLDDNNELDVEFVRAWTGTNNVSYATQPARPGNTYHFYAEFTEGNYSTHRFIWETNSIFYQSYFGHAEPPPASGFVIAEWTYASNSIPVAGGERVHLNMWLFQGRAPADTNHLELILHDFTHVPSTNVPLPAPRAGFHDDFNDGALSNAWGVFNDPDFIVETNGTLRVNPYGSEADQFGIVTTGGIPWSAASGCVYEAQLDWIHVVETNSAADLDVKALLAVVSEAESVWFATNAAVLLAGYDSASNTLHLEFNTKTNARGSMGTTRFTGTITNTAAYLGQGGLTLRVHLDGAQFRVSALTSERDPIPIAGTPADATGYHLLGGTLTNGHFAVGGQDWYEGRAYIYYDEVSVSPTGAIPGAEPPPPASNVVVIGSAAESRRNPVNAYYEQERLTTLYLAREVGWTGTLTSLALHIRNRPLIPLSNYTIRVQHSTLTSMPKGWITNGWTTVYRADAVITNAGWHSFTLTNLNYFHFNGTNNLLVDFSKSNDGWSDSGSAWFSRTNVNRSYEQYIDDSTDPLTWTGETPLRNGYSPPVRHRYIPHIQFVFSDDGDADGLPDAWELRYKPTLTNMNAATDADEDGFTDWREYRAGTSPADPFSLLHCIECRSEGDDPPVVNWASESNKSYRVERATNLTEGFESVASGIGATPPLNTHTDTTAAAGTTLLFYRIGLE